MDILNIDIVTINTINRYFDNNVTMYQYIYILSIKILSININDKLSVSIDADSSSIYRYFPKQTSLVDISMTFRYISIYSRTSSLYIITTSNIRYIFNIVTIFRYYRYLHFRYRYLVSNF